MHAPRDDLSHPWPPASDAARAQALMQRVADNLRRVLRGQDAAIVKLVAVFASGGHLLLDDVPGTGKTTAAKALARSVNASFLRIQFTPDLLPSDILGASVFDPRDRSFHFHQGPVFADVVLADEVNRASPRTQSALLEAMAERQVTVDRIRHPLSHLFFVIATQNPIEFQGTYPLPEAQMDRFAMRLRLGFVAAEHEVAILDDHAGARAPIDALRPCLEMEEWLGLRQSVAAVRVRDTVKRYIVDLVAATRACEGVVHGASPRASLAMLKTAQALALFNGQPMVTPEEVRAVCAEVVAHRLVLDPQARYAGRSAELVAEELLGRVPAPR